MHPQGFNVSCRVSIHFSQVGAHGGVRALAAERSVSGRVSMRRQLPLRDSGLHWLVPVRGHGQRLPLPRLQEAQLSNLQGMRHDGKHRP